MWLAYLSSVIVYLFYIIDEQKKLTAKELSRPSPSPWWLSVLLESVNCNFRNKHFSHKKMLISSANLQWSDRSCKCNITNKKDVKSKSCTFSLKKNLFRRTIKFIKSNDRLLELYLFNLDNICYVVNKFLYFWCCVSQSVFQCWGIVITAKSMLL